MFLVTPAGAWSLLHIGQKLDTALVERLMEVRREEVPAGGGRYLTVYSGEETAAGTQAGHPVSSKFVIRKITYDTGLARQAVLQVLLSSIVVLAIMLFTTLLAGGIERGRTMDDYYVFILNFSRT